MKRLFEDNSSKNINTLIKQTSVEVNKDSNGAVSVIARTPRLLLRPVCTDDIAFYDECLWGSEEVMAKFGDGKPRKEKRGYESYASWRIRDAENSFINRWQSGNPYSGYSIIVDSDNELIGHIIIGGGELAYLLKPSAWNHKYATEATIALTHVVLPSLIEHGFKPMCGEQEVQNITATVRADHLPSQRILDNNGFITSGKIDKKVFEGKECDRLIFTVPVATLCVRYSTVKDRSNKARILPPSEDEQKKSPTV